MDERYLAERGPMRARAPAGAAVDYARDGLLSCPVCGPDAAWEPLTEVNFPAVKCAGCGLGAERHLRVPAAGYTRDGYGRLRSGGTEADPWARWHHDVAVAEHRVKQARAAGLGKPEPGDGWVDYGCGAGALPAVAARYGFTGIGVEPHVESIVAPVHKVAAEDWLLFPLDNVTVVSATDVLEHLPDPTAVVRAAHRDLTAWRTEERTDGRPRFLLIEVPDLDAAADFPAWKHRRITRDFTEHVWHFTEGALRKLVARYAPDLTVAAAARPVPGKLQVIWTTGG